MLNSTLSTGTEKTVRIDAFVRVVATGHACQRRMPWESPFVQFETDDGTKYLWHSDSIPAQLQKLELWHEKLAGKDFGVSMLVRGNRVWRVNKLYPVE